MLKTTFIKVYDAFDERFYSMSPSTKNRICLLIFYAIAYDSLGQNLLA